MTARGATTEALRRPFTLGGAELRSTPDGTGGEKVTFLGYACVTNRSYEMWDDAGSYPETVARGAFAGTLAKSPDVKFLLNHGGLPLARSSGGTLDLREDNTGLHVEARLNQDHADFRYVRSAIERGDLNAMSFAFRILDEQGGWNEDFTKRTITQADLNGGDVALVNDPASPHTLGFPAMRGRDHCLTVAHVDARRRRSGTSMPADLVEHMYRAAKLRSGSTGRHTRKSGPPPDLQTYEARAWALRHAIADPPRRRV